MEDKTARDWEREPIVAPTGIEAVGPALSEWVILVGLLVGCI